MLITNLGRFRIDYQWLVMLKIILLIIKETDLLENSLLSNPNQFYSKNKKERSFKHLIKY